MCRGLNYPAGNSLARPIASSKEAEITMDWSREFPSMNFLTLHYVGMT
jgi:hypothetical protein